MRYIISDIHGCYDQYQMLLEKIYFAENDKLYVLGDVVDRGPEPIKVLQDMMRRGNVIFILGNHDFIMYTLLEKLDMLDYIAEASLYEVIENNGKEYRLVHAGLANFSPDKDLDEYDLYDFLEERVDYSKRYYPDENIFLVTGHTPTIFIKGWEKTEIYRKNGHIHIFKSATPDKLGNRM